MNVEKCDYIVVGSGIAGLRASLELVKKGTVKVFCKGDPWESNTRWAQGGIAAAMQEGDTVEFHLQDTLNAGDELCYEPAVRILVEDGPQRIEELVNWGAQFDQKDGSFVFGREGAHSQNRILHAGDATGKEIVRALLNWVQQTSGIEIIAYRPAVNLIIQNGRACGVVIMDQESGKRSAVLARTVLLATGGAGQIYSHTTNPPAATGDGVAMAMRAGAEMMDIEFFQFHPTAFHFSGAPRFLLTEALRGEGATLKNTEGKAFMKKYHAMGDLAPRDIVSRAIVSEMNATGSSWVYLDSTGISRKKLYSRFPNIHQFLQGYELDLAQDLIPVSPSAHYWMGGVRTGLDGETSINGLFAAGEVACTGVHGANRLASNSLLEGLVYGARCGETMVKRSFDIPESFQSDPLTIGYLRTNPEQLRTRLQSNNWKYLGLIRNETGINAAVEFLQETPIFDPTNVVELELINLLECSKLMGSFALQRRESRGSHFREDYPSRNPDWNGFHSILRNGKIELNQL